MEDPAPPALRAIGLTKRYANGRQEKTAVSGVTLSLPAASFWVICGPSGSGKTTLLGLLAGMIAPTSGEVHLHGRRITHLRDHHRALVRRNGVGVVFQEFALVTGLSVRENLFLPFVPEGGPSAATRDRAAAWLGRFGVAALGLRIAWRWRPGPRPGQSDEAQLTLERQAELVAAVMQVVLGVGIVGLALSVFVADHLVGGIRGAMCAFGVLASTGSGLAGLAVSALAAVACGG